MENAAQRPQVPNRPASIIPVPQISEPISETANQRKHVTVLFADIVGSTKLVAGLDPEDARDFLNRSVEQITHSIEAAGGVVAKTMGDGLFSLFGAPLAQEDHAYRACHAALDLIASTKHLKAPDGSHLRLRVGLCSGTAVVNVSEENGRVGLDAIGEVVNDAAHLEEAAKPGTVLISESTRQLAGHAIEVLRFGESSGYRLLSVGSNPRDLMPEDSSVQLPFLGRYRELGFLVGAAEQLADGTGDIISVLGSAGMGKTRLLLEFSHHLQPSNIRVAVSSNRALDRSDPNALLRRLVMTLLKIDLQGAPDPAQELAQKISSLDESLAEHVDDVVWLLLSESEGTDQQAAEQRRFSALNALKRMLKILASDEPVVIIIDNFQWSDASSRNFLNAVSNIVDTEPLLLLLFSREDLPDFRATARQIIQLKPLERNTAKRLLSRQFTNPPLSSALVDRVLERAEGNPRFLTEFARHLSEREEEVGSEDLSDQIGVPDSVVDIFEERIDRLPIEAKQLLQLGAAFESPASLKTLCALSIRNETTTLDLLETTINAGLVRETGFLPFTLYTFVNPIVGEAAYRSLLREDRRRLHQRIYDHLNQDFQGRGRQRMMGRQAFRAGLFEQSAKAYFEAGRIAGARLAYTESTELLRLALRAEARVLERTSDIDQLAIDIRLTQREGLYANSRFDEIEKRLNEAQAICDRIDDSARSRLVRRHLVGNSAAQGQLGDALPQVKTLIRDNQDLGEHREVAELQFLQAQILAALGRYTEAFSSARAVMGACSKFQGTPHELSPITYALARMWLIWCAAELGRFEDVKFEMLDCQNDLTQDRPPLFRILAGIATGLFWLRYGNDELATETLQSILALTEVDENIAWFHVVASPLGLALIRLGKPETALPLLQRAVSNDTRGQGTGGHGTHALHLALCWAALGDLRKAEDQARVTIARARQTGDLGVLAYALHALGEILFQNRQEDKAEKIFQEAVEIARGCEMQPLLKQISQEETYLW